MIQILSSKPYTDSQYEKKGIFTFRPGFTKRCAAIVGNVLDIEY